MAPRIRGVDKRVQSIDDYDGVEHWDICQSQTVQHDSVLSLLDSCMRDNWEVSQHSYVKRIHLRESYLDTTWIMYESDRGSCVSGENYIEYYVEVPCIDVYRSDMQNVHTLGN